MPSKYLPENFDHSKTLCLIAGRGNYPILLAKSAKSAGVKIKLIAFEGETDESFYNSFSDSEKITIKVGQVGKMLKWLKVFEASYAVMAGQITPRKLFKGMLPDLKAITMLAKLKKRNAETIFGAIAEEIEKLGVKLLDARAFMDAFMAPAGFFSGKNWDISPENLDYAINVTRECAKLDIGQGAVFSRGTVIAVEAFEGTDPMLERAGTFGAKHLLFVKTVKNNQDYRFDVPVIGLRTLQKLAAANIRNVVLEAGKVIILDYDEAKLLAEKEKIKIFGI